MEGQAHARDAPKGVCPRFRILLRLPTRGAGASDASEGRQGAEVQSRDYNAPCNRPLAHCKERVPIAEWPEEDRDEVLYPAMDRRKTASSHRKMGGCCVVEDTDQKVDYEDKPSRAEKKPYISSDSRRCGPPGGVPESHLCSPPVWTLKVVRMSDRFCGQYPGYGDHGA